MLENLNLSLFSLINATPDSAPWMISLAIFIAKDLITVVPLLYRSTLVVGAYSTTATGDKNRYRAGGQPVCVSGRWDIFFPHDRPFVENIGYNFLHHAADDSFPSDHGTVIFTFALAFLCWHRLWSGSLLMVLVRRHCLVARLSWRPLVPLDMLGGLLAGMIGCLSAQIIWQAMGHKLYQRLQSWYRFCFALPIRKGWVRD